MNDLVKGIQGRVAKHRQVHRLFVSPAIEMNNLIKGFQLLTVKWIPLNRVVEEKAFQRTENMVVIAD